MALPAHNYPRWVLLSVILQGGGEKITYRHLSAGWARLEGQGYLFLDEAIPTRGIYLWGSVFVNMSWKHLLHIYEILWHIPIGSETELLKATEAPKMTNIKLFPNDWNVFFFLSFILALIRLQSETSVAWSFFFSLLSAVPRFSITFHSGL